MIAEGMTIVEVASVGIRWPERLRHLRPKNVLELGTGQGASGAQIMSALAPDAVFTTVNYADGHVFGEQLSEWYTDARLTRVSADTLSRATLDMVPDGVDLMFIDTTHEAWHAAEELTLWQDKLQDGAIVVLDDLDQHDMQEFWDSIPYEKATQERQGVFRYDAAVRYEGRFDRPEKTTYGGST